MSILTFNISVTNRKELSETNVPFQIMPTGNHGGIIYPKTVESYIPMKNPNIIIHVSYMTRPFGNKSTHPDSKFPVMMKGYVDLGRRLGTKNILIHAPASAEEFSRSAIGIKLIYDHLIKHDMVLQLEIPAWTKDFIETYKIRERKPIEYMSGYIDGYIKLLSGLSKTSNFKIVFDTAHLWSNGCEVDDMIEIMEKYKEYIEFIHLNGNARAKYIQDAHAPLFSPQNVIPNWEKLAKFCAELNKICVIEQTAITASMSDYIRFADTFKYNLVIS